MRVSQDRLRAVELLDALVERRRRNLFPYYLKRAILPQTLIPEELRNDKDELARFYFFVCIYMRGGIESNTAFRQILKLWKDSPDFFNPEEVSKIPLKTIQSTLKKYVGWDSKVAGEYWGQNAKRLHNYWGGDALRIVDGVNSYDGALKRVTNKRQRAGSVSPLEQGFVGFQEKMTSMLLYFLDWEGMLQTNFPYPPPADFHHYRLMIANGVLEVIPSPGTPIRYHDSISRSIRDVLMWYQKSRRIDPIELGDTLWLFSRTLCGESPATVTSEDDTYPKHHGWGPSVRKRFFKTCGMCPLETTCQYSIPSKPYYRRGIIELRKRPKVTDVEPLDQFSFDFPDV